MKEKLNTVRSALEAPEYMTDADLMFCINGANNELDHLPYNDVKKVASRVCRIISSRNAPAKALIDEIIASLDNPD